MVLDNIPQPSAPFKIKIHVVCAEDKYKEWRESNWSGTYNCIAIYDSRPVYEVGLFFYHLVFLVILVEYNRSFSEGLTNKIQRDENTDDDKESYLWYRRDSMKWRLSPGSDFHAKNDQCWLSLNSSGEK